MRAWVTGGHGFIGSRLVERLRKEGWEVWVWPDILIVPMIYNDRRPDVIFHLAAVTRNAPSIADPLRTMKVNVYGSAKVFALAKDLKVPVVYASSNVVYSTVLTPYHISKMAADDYAQWLQSQGQLITVLRFADTYGAGMKSGLFHTWRQQYQANGVIDLWNGGLQTRDYIHVNDVVEAMLLAIGHRVGPLDICTGIQTSFREVARLLGVPTRRVSAPIEVAGSLDQYPEPAYGAIEFEHSIVLREGLKEIRTEWGLTNETGEDEVCADSI